MSSAEELSSYKNMLFRLLSMSLSNVDASSTIIVEMVIASLDSTRVVMYGTAD